MLKHVFEAISVATGLWAAWLWWLSSEIPVAERVAPFPPGQSTGDPEFERIGEIAATTQNMLVVGKSARDAALLNGRAAILTATSVGAQAVATGLGWITSG